MPGSVSSSAAEAALRSTRGMRAPPESCSVISHPEIPLAPRGRRDADRVSPLLIIGSERQP